jgi:hypothetical protein
VKGVYRLAQSREFSTSVQRLHLSAQTEGYSLSKSPQLLRWRYKTRPNVLGREYDVLINYLKGHEPSVFVIAPDLNELSENEIPHIYHSTIDAHFHSAVCLCLYMKKYGEWNGEKIIADTVVPWVDLWLFFFEIWLATGEWDGGGEHPS